MKRIHVFNPAAGGGRSPDILSRGAAIKEECYVTTCIGDAEKFIFERCNINPETHFIVYGGDGTVSEAANGIIKAKAGEKALLSVVPSGTGNDFVRSFPIKNKIYTIDALKFNERYAVNIVNVGFDCNVVQKTNNYKTKLSGSSAYIAGVANTFFRKIGEQWSITLEDSLGKREVLSGEYTLALAANCKYYGGGFYAAPLSNPSDGLIDFIAIKKVSRATFLRLISSYKKGKHLSAKTMSPTDGLEKYIIYRKCKRVVISGINNICSDGEIAESTKLDMSIAPSVLRIAT